MVEYDKWGYPRGPSKKNLKRKHQPTTESPDLSVEDRKNKDLAKLIALKGISDEIANAALNEFGTYDEFVKELFKPNSKVIRLPGISERKRQSLMRQLEKEE